MPASTAVTIKPLPLRKIPELHRLFVSAVRTNFTYFDKAVQDKVIRNHHPLKLMLATLHPRRMVLSAWIDGKLVGYSIGSVPANGEGQLYWLYVSPDNRGSNTGLSLLSRTLKMERALGAHTVTLATYDHRRYYERQGFKFVDTREVDGLEMAIMRYTL